MTYQIRPMFGSDWPRVSEIYQQGIDSNQATFDRVCPSWEDWDGSHLKNCRLVITEDETVVGWAALSPVSSRCAYTGVAELSIYMDSCHRRLGLGKQLLNAIIALSEDNDFWTLQSSIIQGNLASIRLHEGCGFRTVGYRERIARDQFETWKNTVLMERRSERECFDGFCSCCG